ncbi:lysine biosynthesis protein LysW [Candidatus Cerribacteria bacterium 'Amazon FNV 2010 28 9']|uniref:Lysine biosynthesis protein LysW n=1 Tax=Candidatus Cerribacteria bacterium 'Amazon FNV 2010 28 9' TaxID=2081795 RepID=A0A317JUE8_9BACT|nr:MAG: lysine biosynthesis protein LysW [Candidatus Cerribacteria bacterium 'Amazon FNV 2010 28 9']
MNALCPECEETIELFSDTQRGEIVSCPVCGAEFEVTRTEPTVTLELTKPDEEDIGE